MRDLAAALHAHDEIKAVWLDAKKREVNFAFLPGTDEAAIREKLKAVVAKPATASIAVQVAIFLIGTHSKYKNTSSPGPTAAATSR